MSPETPDADGAEYTVLKDSGTGCALLLLGWIPPLVAALVSGVIVAVRTGSLGDLAQVLIGGTLFGYVASVITLFTIGHLLEQRGVGPRLANAFLILVLVIGVAVAIAVAVAVDSGPSEVRVVDGGVTRVMLDRMTARMDGIQPAESPPGAVSCSEGWLARKDSNLPVS